METNIKRRKTVYDSHGLRPPAFVSFFGIGRVGHTNEQEAPFQKNDGDACRLAVTEAPAEIQ